MWNGTMFVDLDWPLNASSLLSFLFVENDDHFDLLDEPAGQFSMYDFELTKVLILRK